VRSWPSHCGDAGKVSGRRRREYPLRMSAVCPSCGVTVVPGYRRCPKCHAALPYGSGRRTATIDPGGTSLPERSLPVVPIVAGVAVLGLIVVLAIVFGGGSKAPAPAAQQGTDEASAPAGAAPVAPSPSAPAPVAAAPTVAAPTRAPGAEAASLEIALRKQRLWSTVEVTGTRIDVRSSGCSEAAMGPTIAARTDGLRSAGLTRLRCMEQSGRVVFERDL